jgi:dolichol-phosphate mannosyltransferase
VTTRTRFLRFNLIGIAGFFVQLLTLTMLSRCTGMPTPAAVAIAVLAAVSHNFIWHERFTWPGLPRDGRVRRWLWFNAANGLVSLGTNLAVTSLAMTVVGAHLLVANAIAVVAASFLNFVAGDRLVFTRRPRSTPSRGIQLPGQAAL